MPKLSARKLSVQIRLGNKQKALEQAVTVPWRRLEEAASRYVEWHSFILWVRTITEAQPQPPEIVLTALEARCPGFLEDERQAEQRRPRQQPFHWHFLEEWVADNQFSDAKAEGWFDALMYYAYKDLRTEKAWTLWERTREVWRRERPFRWPTLEEWTDQVTAIDSLSETETEKGRAVEALPKVESARLTRATSDVLESRAFALWVGCVSERNRPLDEPALSGMHGRYPRLYPKESAEPVWNEFTFLRLVRAGEADWRRSAREEGWYSALRYHVVHHPRYHRLVHYNQRCCAVWEHARPISYPCFQEWLAAADEYCLAQRD